MSAARLSSWRSVSCIAITIWSATRVSLAHLPLWQLVAASNALLPISPSMPAALASPYVGTTRQTARTTSIAALWKNDGACYSYKCKRGSGVLWPTFSLMRWLILCSHLCVQCNKRTWNILVQIFKYIYITTLVLSYLTYNQIDNMQSKLHSNYIITTYNYIITTCKLHWIDYFHAF